MVIAKKIRTNVFYAAMSMITFYSHCLAAQETGIAYTSEFQTDFRKGTKWVNLLRAEFEFPIGKNFGMEMASISIAETHERPLIDDWQGFSNIEEENTPLALAVLGIRWQLKKSFLFVGVRNLNEDYFTSPYTSLFTNSSCGIFPTLSVNYPIANYPLASIGIDYKYKGNRWSFEASAYNGVGYKRLTGRENVFRFCPESDGILGISTINYQNNGSSYYMGFALRNGMSACYEKGTEESKEKKEWNALVWGYAEQKLSAHWHALIQYSVNPTVLKGCRSYAGGALVLHCGKLESGVFAGYAGFAEGNEWSGELTCRIACLHNMYIQPAFHVIKNSRLHGCIGLLRLGYEIRKP